MRPDWETSTLGLVYGFIAVRMIIDLVFAAIISFQTGTWITGGGFWVLCWVFYLLLFFAFRSGTFHGTYGRKVRYSREPGAWWFVFGVIALFHMAVTVVFASNVIDWQAILASTGHSGL